jgi:PAS domain S-box-containing protein
MNNPRTTSIMVVDDDPVARQVIATMVTRLGYRLHATASCADEALATAQQEPPDLVLMDAQMPHHPGGQIEPYAGLDTAQTLQQFRPTPVILVTGTDTTAFVEDASQAGVSGFLVKPFTDRELSRVVVLALARFRDLQTERRLHERMSQLNEQLKAEVAMRQETEAALRASEAKYRTLAENAPDVFLRFDHQLVLIYVSANVAAMTGHEAAYYEGMVPYQLGLPDDEATSLETALLEVFATGEQRELEVSLDSARGALALSLRLVPEYDDQGTIATVLGVVRDVTDLKEAQVALQRSQQLAAVGTLAAGIAHQFNNLHAIIQGNVDLMLADPQLGDRQRQRLQAIRQSVMRGTETIQKLTAMSRQANLHKERTHLAELVREALSLEAAELANEGVACNFEAEPHVPPVLVDRGQVVMVLRQLLANARHAMLAVADRRLLLTLRAGGEMVMLEITDSGPGIPPEHLTRIFLPFFTTKGEHAEAGSPLAQVRGTGLGLTICETIVKSHDGTLSVTSQPGQGATFTIALPAVPAATEGPGISDTVELRGIPPSRLSILVIDDEQMIRWLLAEILTNVGYPVDTTGDAREGLAWLQQRDYALVILDLHMPLMSGLEFLRQMHQAQLPRLPNVLIISGRATDDLAPTLCDFGVVGVLDKPFELEPTLQRVRAALVRRPAPR